MKGKRLTKEEREKKEKALKLAKKKWKKRLEFAEDYLENHTYLSAKSVSVKYEDLRMGMGNPTKNNVWYFGAILRRLKEKGLIEKYNSHQYKK